MIIRIDSKRLLATIATGYFTLGFVGGIIGMIVCLVGGSISPSQTILEKIGIYLMSPTLSGVSGAVTWMMLCVLYAAGTTIGTWIAVRIGLLIANICPGITLQENANNKAR